MPQNKIYVGNIAYAAELEEIQSLFEPYGTIEDIAMAMDKETEKFRGFAIVMMPNVEEAAKAIAGVDGHLLRGRRLVVNMGKKRRRSPREAGPEARCPVAFDEAPMLGRAARAATRGVVEGMRRPLESIVASSSRPEMGPECTRSSWRRLKRSRPG
jgi:RNA recognition motif-containing protein